MFTMICRRVAYKTHDSMSKVKVTKVKVKFCNLYLVRAITSQVIIVFMPRHTKYEGHIVFRSVSPSVRPSFVCRPLVRPRLRLKFLVKLDFSEADVLSS